MKAAAARDAQVSGRPVRVRRGYSRRPARITDVREDGRVTVRFLDVDPTTARGLSPFQTSGLYGATVRLNAITEEETPR